MNERAAALPLRLGAEVLGNHAEGAQNFRLQLSAPAWPGAAPGQFVMLSPGAHGAAERYDPLLPRPMAVYRALANGSVRGIEILYKVAGRGTRLLAETRAGERLRMVGPLGAAFPLPRAGERALLVGGGTGVASLYELAVRARERGPLTVLLGARSAADLMGLRDFAALGVDLRVATEDGSEGVRGRVTELLDAELDEGREAALVYACGPTPMMRRASELAAARRLRCVVSLENHMACGFGVCLGCAVPRAGGGFALVCHDGPVLDAGAVAWTGLP